MANFKMAVKSKMADKYKMAPASFQPIWVKICMHHLLVRPKGYHESKMTQIILRHNFFSGPKFLGDTNFWGNQIFLGTQIVLGPKFVSGICSGQQEKRWQTFLGPTFFCQKLSGIAIYKYKFYITSAQL